MSRTLPPPVIDSAKLLAYAYVDEDVEFTGRIKLFVGGERLGPVPCLAITRNYCEPDDILVEFCDEEWNARGVTAHASLEEAKAQAERGYRGITAKWAESPYTLEQTNEFLRDNYGVDPHTEWWKTLCSFCGKDVAKLRAVASSKAVICGECVAAFHADLANDRGT